MRIGELEFSPRRGAAVAKILEWELEHVTVVQIGVFTRNVAALGDVDGVGDGVGGGVV